MKYTITSDSTNEIVRVISLDNRLIDYSPDPEAVLSEFLAVETDDDESWHEGNFKPEFYMFNGVEFIQKNERDYLPPELRSPEETLFTLISQMRAAGHNLPMHADVIRNRRDAYAQVNLALSETCEKYVSPGKFMNLVYMFKEQAVKDWRAAGSDESNPPELLSSHFDNEPFASYDAAAVDIERQAEQMRNVIASAERIRLEARKAINAATENFDVLIKPFITRINQI